MANPVFIKAAAKLATQVLKDPEEGTAIIVKCVIGIASFFVLIAIVAMCMIGGFGSLEEDAATVNSSFSGANTKAYKQIIKGYQVFESKLERQMLTRERKIIQDNTFYEEVIKIDPLTELEYTTIEKVVRAKVYRTINRLNVSYYFSYMNHNVEDYDVKKGKRYYYKASEIMDFCESISKMEERKEEGDEYDTYYLFNSILPESEVASMYFKEDTEQQMYLQSFALYARFFPLYPPVEGGGADDEKPEGDDDIFFPDMGMNIPHYFQSDYKDVPYGDGSIASDGCAPTSIAMVLSYLKNTNVSVIDVINFTGNRYYVSGQGSAWSIFGACAAEWGVGCQNLGKDTNAVIDAIKNGKPVIVSVGPGVFTRSGHLMVIRGVTSDGYFLINDPYRGNVNKYKTDKFACGVVFSQAKNFWCFG